MQDLRVDFFDLGVLDSEEREQFREHSGVGFDGAPPLVHLDQLSGDKLSLLVFEASRLTLRLSTSVNLASCDLADD